mmetsp:Transcript_4321/g.13866  ORF Transcript_4321/g.13866 Transcript_4321/m.13866 type:complete len:323 (-) Transcript_4321:101-1069(-)
MEPRSAPHCSVRLPPEGQETAASCPEWPSVRRRAFCWGLCLLLGCSSTLLLLDSDAVLRRGLGSLGSVRGYPLVAGVLGQDTLARAARHRLVRFLDFAATGASSTWTMDSFPNPRLDPGACGLRTAPGLICDPDALLTNSSRLAIEDRLQRLQRDLSYVLGVAVMDRLDVTSLTPWLPNWRQDSKVDIFARNLIRHWKLGGGRNGVMLVVVRDPDYVAIYAEKEAARRGLDQTLCRSIADYGVLPYVDNGYVDRGIVSGVEEIAVALRHPPEPMHPWQMSEKLFVLCCLVTFLASVVCVCGCCCRCTEDEAVLQDAQVGLRR